MQAGLKMYHVDLARRRCGVPEYRLGRPVQAVPGAERAYNSGEPGIGDAAAQWLADHRRSSLVGADTWAVEVIPSEDTSVAFPVHKMLLTDNGIHIIENVRTDLIAAEAAADKRATFFLNMTVPKAVGLTGTFVNIQAIQ